MSKMSEIAMEIDEQLAELGFETIEQAEANGYHITYTKNKVRLALDMEKEQEKAHKAWLKEREDIHKRLNELYDELVYIGIDEEYLATINDAIEFIRGIKSE